MRIGTVVTHALLDSEVRLLLDVCSFLFKSIAEKTSQIYFCEKLHFKT